MAEAKSVTITFVDEGPKDFSYSVDRAEDARLDASESHGELALFLNAAGCSKLAEMLVKLACSSYHPGYHIHIGKNFDPDQDDVLCLTLTEK